MSYQSRRCIPPSHPSLPGHFPGHPVVPGVVLLDAVLETLAEWRPQAHVAGMPQVKFLSPLEPGESFDIRFTEAATGRLKFECATTRGVIATGQLELRVHTGGAA